MLMASPHASRGAAAIAVNCETHAHTGTHAHALTRTPPPLFATPAAALPTTLPPH